MEIQLRKMTNEDAISLYPLTSDSLCGKYMKTGPHQTLGQTKEMVQKYCNKPNFGFIIETDQNEIVGYTGLSMTEQQGEYTISIMTFPKFWQGGLSTKAIQMTLDFAKNEPTIKKIIAYIVLDNIASIKICEKCGFTHITTFIDREMQVGMCELNVENELLQHIDQIHTTPMGLDRIKRNLKLDSEEVVGWCKEVVLNKEAKIERKGKNWYVTYQNIILTINAYSYTIITAHLKK